MNNLWGRASLAGLLMAMGLLVSSSALAENSGMSKSDKPAKVKKVQICDLKRAGDLEIRRCFSLEKYLSYDPKRFTLDQMMDLDFSGMDGKTANGIDDRFLVDDTVKYFAPNDIDGEFANPFDSPWGAEDIAYFKKRNYDSSLINTYDGKRWNRYDVDAFIRYDIPGSDIKGVAEIYSAAEIINMHRNGMKAKDMNEYSERFLIGPDGKKCRNGFKQIITLWANDVRGRVANKYHPRFNGQDVALLFSKRITHNTANRFDPIYSARQIWVFDINGVGYLCPNHLAGKMSFEKVLQRCAGSDAFIPL